MFTYILKTVNDVYMHKIDHYTLVVLKIFPLDKLC